MVLSVKTAATAGYYFQDWGADKAPISARGMWFRRPRGLGFGGGNSGKDRTVARKDLERLLHRKTIDACETPTFSLKDKSSGYDFVFSTPKSVSALWAVAPDWRPYIEHAHQKAVERTVCVLARHTLRERVGKGGRSLRPARGAIAAFFHNKCRPARHPGFADHDEGLFPDPTLHTHIVIPDIVVGTASKKERRLKIAYTTLYARWSMALGAWYHANLAYELRRCGLPLSKAGANGVFQLDIFAEGVVKSFCARTEGARNLGRNTHFVDALAATKRRASKLKWAEIETRWGQLMATHKKVFQSETDTAPEPKLSQENQTTVELDGLLGKALEALAESDAVLQEPDLFRCVAMALVADGRNLKPHPKMVQALIDRSEMMQLQPTASYGFQQWTTRTNLRAERQVVALAERLGHEKFRSARLSDQARSGFTWSDAQWNAARKLAGANRLVLLCGVPGAGKTRILEPVVHAYRRRHGLHIMVAAEAWQTALDTGKKCGADETYSLAMLFAKQKHGRLPRLGENCLLIVDEAGLLCTARMRQLLAIVEATGCKLILLGDSSQLCPIGAGSGFELVKKAVPAIELEELYRPQTDDQRSLAESLVAVAASDRRENSKDADDATARLAQLCARDDKWRSHPNSRAAVDTVARAIVGSLCAQNPTNQVVALTRSHREAQHVTRVVRALLREKGALAPDDAVVQPAVTPMGTRHRLRLAVGDRIRFLVRHRRHKVVNGTRGVIVAISGDPKNPEIRVQIHERDGISTLAPLVCFHMKEFFDADGNLLLACDYASTIFGSQGATYDEVIVLRSRAMVFRELYVALTRARLRASVIDVDADRARYRDQMTPGLEDRHHEKFLASILVELAKAKSRDKAIPLALDVSEPPRRNSMPERRPWFWDFMVLEKDVA